VKKVKTPQISQTEKKGNKKEKKKAFVMCQKVSYLGVKKALKKG
jgi:hypothetical protein